MQSNFCPLCKGKIPDDIGENEGEDWVRQENSENIGYSASAVPVV